MPLRASARLALLAVPLAALGPSPARPAPACAPDNGGLTLPAGLCAVIVADGLKGPRQLAVTPDGVLYVAVQGAEPGAGVLALRDRDGDGLPDERATFGPAGGNDVALRDGYLYLALRDRIVRWKLVPGRLAPEGEPEEIVGGLPTGGHAEKSVAFGAGDAMYVNIGSLSNSCQERDRVVRSPGRSPCAELEERAGIWRFSATRPGQRQADGRRFATGIRNANALAVHPVTGLVYAAPHGRDQLAQNWGFSEAYGAENPAEEFLQVDDGDDFGWPFCYWSNDVHAKVLAPEYGGDGKARGRCTSAKDPLVAFPGHWGPMDIAFATGPALGPAYADGAFVAFHGSWNRAPLPQEGYRVVWLPFEGGKPTGRYETFAIGSESDTWLRPAGLALAADGLYISADQNGRVWKVVRKD